MQSIYWKVCESEGVRVLIYGPYGPEMNDIIHKNMITSPHIRKKNQRSYNL